MIRCPKCKTVLAVEGDPGPAPPPQPAAPAAATKTSAPPLPFGRPANAPKPAIPVPGPVPARPVAARPAAAPVRARLAPIQTSELNDQAGQSEKDAERKREMRKALRKFEEAEARAAEHYEELTEECEQGRTALMLMAGSAYLQALGCVLLIAGIVLFFAVSTDYLNLAPIAGLGIGGLGLLLSAGAFGFAIPGPTKARHIAIAGVMITLFQAGFCIVQIANALKNPPKIEVTGWWDTLPIEDRFGMATNLPFLAEHPARLLKSYPISVYAILVAALEFARLVMLGMLVQTYAAEGKDPELGHQVMQLVSKIFWVVLLSAMFRISAASAFDWMPREDLMAQIGKGAHAILTIGTPLLIMAFLLWLGQAIRDAIDVVDPKRFLHEGERMEF